MDWSRGLARVWLATTVFWVVLILVTTRGLGLGILGVTIAAAVPPLMVASLFWALMGFKR